MKNLKLLLLLAAIALTLCLIGCGTYATGHKCEFVEYEREESTCSERGVSYLSCYCGELDEKYLPLANHTEITVPGKEATCSEEGHSEYTKCAVCQKITANYKIIEKMIHTKEIDPAIPAENGKPGKTEGVHCSVCGEILLKQKPIFADAYSTPESYDGDYAYSYLASLPYGNALVTLYDRMDAAADDFHVGITDVGEDYVAAQIDYSDLGLTDVQAMAVWSAYKMDRPLYYWISNNITYTSKYINIHVTEDYADRDVREALNSDIYAAAERYISSASGTDAYSLSLAFHDKIIESSSYAYEDDGVTPETSPGAHNIVGILLDGTGVCESYTKTFQLLLNYCGVENIFVSGYANEPHAWNLVEIEEGEWYWFDLTWDDSPEFMWGVIYNYFCVTDNQNTGWRDGAWTVPAETFISSHIPDAPQDTGIEFMYSLPARAATEYDGILRDTFSIDGLTYAISGYNTVQLVSIDKGGSIGIPDRITYMGDTYTVKSIGKIEDGVFKNGAISSEYIYRIYIPRDVVYIFDQAFSIDGLVEVLVDEANKRFSFEDGLLYDKKKTYIHALIDKNITTLYIGPKVMGWSNNGTVFYNCLNLSEIIVDESNPYFVEYGGVVYNKEMTEIVLVPRAISGTLILADTLTALGSESANASINYRSHITALVIPRSVTELTETFDKCTSLDSVYYGGTSSEWDILTGGADFDFDVYFYSEAYISNGWRYVDGVPTLW